MIMIIPHEDIPIAIYEVNSGYQDHKDFNRILTDIMKLITDKLNSIKMLKFSQINSLTFIEYPLMFFRYKEGPLGPNIPVKKILRVVFVGEPLPPNRNEKLFTGGETHFSDKIFLIKIGINKDNTGHDILNGINRLETIISHELTHVFQNLYDNYHKTQTYYKKMKNKDNSDPFGTWYWTNRYEIEAYTTQINTQLRQIKKEIPDIKFKSAILKIQGYKDLNKFLPEEHKDILKRVLSKTVNFWMNNLGGKINEFKIIKKIDINH